jgi:glycopeptide antibiotics resistance protein
VLEIPEKFVPVRPAFLKNPTDGDLRNWSDIVLNVIGFVPWGVSFAICLQARRTMDSTRTIALSTLTAFGISLFIEILQVYLPSRDSSLLDLIMNTFGGLIGAGLAIVLRTKFVGARE